MPLPISYERTYYKELAEESDYLRYRDKLHRLAREKGILTPVLLKDGIEFDGGIYATPQTFRLGVAYAANTKIMLSLEGRKLKIKCNLSLWNMFIAGSVLSIPIATVSIYKLILSIETDNTSHIIATILLILFSPAGYWSCLSLPISALKDFCNEVFDL